MTPLPPGARQQPSPRLSGRSLLALVAVAGLVATLLLAACRGDGTPAATTTAGPSTPTVSPEQALLQQVTLRAEDLPPSLSQVDASASTNEDVAAGEANPEEELAQLESWGRLLGYEVNFVQAEAAAAADIVALSSAASLYETPDGASASFADAARKARDTDWPASYPDLVDPTVTQLERPGLADEVIWVRISGVQSAEDGRLFTEDFVVMRRDRVRGFLRAVFLTDPAGDGATIQETEDLVAIQVQRIDAALQESSP